MSSLLTLLSMLTVSQAKAEGGFTWLHSLAHTAHVPEHFLTLLLVMIIIVTAGFVYRMKISKVDNVIVPDSSFNIRNLFEIYGQFIYNQIKAVMGEENAIKHFNFMSYLFIVIFLSNLIGLVPGFLPPTEYFSTTLAFGLVAFCYYNIKGCVEMGTLNYLKHFAGPLWYMAILIFPIEILSNFIRPLSLGLRLRGNMMGDHMVLTTFSNLVAYIVPLPFYALGLLVCFIQAYVFTVLTAVYINLATAHHDHDEHGEHH
jgi:F-type H+-transporting ATPase subunit a